MEIGSKGQYSINGSVIPAVVKSKPVTERITLPNGRSKMTQFAWVIGLRTTNPAGPNAGQTYLHPSFEDLAFFYGREEGTDHIEGLDVDADGTIIALAALESRLAKTQAERQASRPRPVQAVSADDLAEAGL